MPWTDLPESFVRTHAAARFTNAVEINQYFGSRGAAGFPEWFNANREKPLWKDIRISAAGSRSFAKAWDNVGTIFGGPCTLMQFLSLASIMINETGGAFEPISENFGYRGHPGIAYLYDAIPEIPKASYNQAPNLTAGELFNDPDFVAAHGGRPLADQLKFSSDARWRGQVYPQGAFPTTGNPNVTGFVLQTDFFKFRGRGLIQTTWRTGYLKLVKFIVEYDGENPVINKYKAWWDDMTLAKAATVSDNEDWDELFQQTDLIVASKAIALHNAAAGDYLALGADAATLNATRRGSIYNVGLRVSGGQAYGQLFRRRVIQLCEAM